MAPTAAHAAHISATRQRAYATNGANTTRHRIHAAVVAVSAVRSRPRVAPASVGDGTRRDDRDGRVQHAASDRRQQRGASEQREESGEGDCLPSRGPGDPGCACTTVAPRGRARPRGRAAATCAERAASEAVSERRLEVARDHLSAWVLASWRLSASRPRWMSVFTLPSEMPRRSAISW